MANNAAIISIIKKITEIKSAPCKKTLQKIVFLIEAKEVDLGCEYGIHFYGPYSSDLDFAIHELSEEGALSIQYTPMEHTISVVDSSLYPDYSDSKVDEVINTFGKETPSELELLATALYVYLKLDDVSKIKSNVIKIKGSKYSPARIDAAIKKLQNAGYVAA